MGDGVPLDSGDDRFACNICLDNVTDPVVTLCGHLYCWPCLFRWLQTLHSNCPVCKAGVSPESVIPLFIRGCERDPRTSSVPSSSLSSSSSSSSSSSIPSPTDSGGGGGGSSGGSIPVPNRPSPRRPPEPMLNIPQNHPTINNALGGQFGNNSNYGFFPSLFGLLFQPRRNDDTQEHLHLSRFLYLLGSLVIISLIVF